MTKVVTFIHLCTYGTVISREQMYLPNYTLTNLIPAVFGQQGGQSLEVMVGKG